MVVVLLVISLVCCLVGVDIFLFGWLLLRFVCLFFFCVFSVACLLGFGFIGSACSLVGGFVCGW